MSPWTVKADGGPAIAPDLAEAGRAIALLFDPDARHELRALPSGRSRHVASSDPDVPAVAAELADEKGLYYTLNPVHPGRAPLAARNGDILRRRWLLVDVDPIRPADTSSTDAEKEAARGVASAVLDALAARGWPAPVLVDSGNGFHLLYRLDLPNDALARQWVASALKALAAAHDAPGATVDRAVHNASRVAKLPGTWSRKGPDTVDRPHRLCRILSAPDQPGIVPAELLRALAGAGPEEAVGKTSPWSVRASDPDGASAYVGAAVDRELARVALAPEGGRNVALNSAAFALGTFLGSREVSRADLESRLEFAAGRAGLGAPEARATIRSGLDAGALKPRDLSAVLDANGHANGHANGKPRETAAADPGMPLVIRASAVRPKAVDWIWHGRIARNFITVFAGQTGIGKSFVTLDVVSRLTRGRDWPDSGGECCAPSNVLLISEDPFEYVLVPRLIELDADLDRVSFMTWEAMARYHLADTAMLDRAFVEADNPPLIVIDPPTNFLKGRDEHKNSEVRQIIMQIVGWLDRHDVACIFITHINKQGAKGVEALNRVVGSIAWTTTSRVAFAFVPDPEDASRALFVPMKSNIGAMPAALAYRVARTETLARIDWLGEVDTTANEAMDADREPPRREVKAADWLLARFAERPEWPSAELFARAAADGISRNAVFGAKKALDLPKARPVCGEDGEREFIWVGPDDDVPPF